MKHGFLKRLLDRAEKIDKERIVDYMIELAQERDLLILIFDSMIEGIIVIDEEESAVFINQSARDILGLGDGPTSPNLPLARVLQNPDLLILCRKGVNSDEPMLSLKYELNLNDGRRYLQFNTIPLQSNSKRFGTLLLFIDETEQKIQEQKLRAAEKLAALTTLSAGVSHEIRNPLNSLSIHLQLLQRHLRKEGIQDKEVKETLDIFEGEIKRLNDVIETFLTAVRPSQPQLRNTNFYNLVTETLRLMEPEFRQNDIRISLHERGEWPMIEADDAQLKQAIINILRNAVDAIVNQSEEERKQKKNEILISMLRDEGTVSLIFVDTGKGIEPQDLPHIFEPYFTTKSKGTGLGLMIVDRIIREHRGTLNAHSEIGKGTHIAMTLPIAGETPRLLEQGKTKAEEIIHVT